MPDHFRDRTAATVHASPMAGLRRRAVRSLVIGMIGGLVLALLGAMGTDSAPLGQRLLYWQAVVLPGSVLGLGITALVRGWGRLSDHRWAEQLVVAGLITVPHSCVVIVASALMFGVGSITPLLVAEFALAVFIVALVMTSINFLAADKADNGVSPPPDAPVVAVPATPAADPPALAVGTMPPAFAERLPPHLRLGRLRALCAQDHYLMVHTDVGHDLVLMRLADAAAMLADVPGARVHRSWWVARDAVTGSRTSNGNLLLLVAGGLEVPVSRSARAAAVQAGLVAA